MTESFGPYLSVAAHWDLAQMAFKEIMKFQKFHF